MERSYVDQWIAEQLGVDDVSKLTRPQIAEFLSENPIPDNIMTQQYIDAVWDVDFDTFKSRVDFYMYLHKIYACLPAATDWYAMSINAQFILNCSRIIGKLYIPISDLTHEARPYFQIMSAWVRAVDKKHGEYAVRRVIHACFDKGRMVEWFEFIYEHLEQEKAKDANTEN